MRSTITFLLIFSLLVLSRATSQDSLDNQWKVAERQIKRLSPSAFEKLPITIVEELIKDDYTIPQCSEHPDPHNVISGEFKVSGKKDWAVLASKDGVSSIIIFWGGVAKDTTHLLAERDIGYLQGGEHEIEYSRLIEVVGKVEISKNKNILNDCSTILIDHDGIENYFWNKASAIYYLHQCKWLEFFGSD